MIDQTFGTFRKKPVVIEAVQFTRRFAWPDWFHDAVSEKTITTHGTGKFADPGKPCFCEIHTLEGDMRGDEGDWIIKGVKGEIYPCKPDIFAMTYEVATPAPAQPEGVSMPQYWSVQVTADGEALVSIGNDWLSGDRPLEQQDEQTIIGAAQHLLSFVGYGLPPSNFNPDDDEAAGAAAPVEGAAASWCRPLPQKPGEEKVRYVYTTSPTKPNDGHAWEPLPYAPSSRAPAEAVKEKP